MSTTESDESVTYSIHHPKWWERWLNPTTAMALFGAVVWGIQLNFAVLQNTKDIGQMEGQQNEIVKLLNEQQQVLVRQTVLISELERRVTKHEDIFPKGKP